MCQQFQYTDKVVKRLFVVVPCRQGCDNLVTTLYNLVISVWAPKHRDSLVYVIMLFQGISYCCSMFPPIHSQLSVRMYCTIYMQWTSEILRHSVYDLAESDMLVILIKDHLNKLILHVHVCDIIKIHGACTTKQLLVLKIFVSPYIHVHVPVVYTTFTIKQLLQQCYDVYIIICYVWYSHTLHEHYSLLVSLFPILKGGGTVLQGDQHVTECSH